MKWSVAVSIGAWSMDSGSDPHAELLEVETEAVLGCPRPAGRVTVYSPPGARSGPAAGAAAIGGGGPAGSGGAGRGTTVRGLAVKPGDPITVELTAGDASETVVTAQVDEVLTTLGAVRILGRGPLQQLAAARVSAVYENQSLGQIVQDLAGRVGVMTGEIDPGATYPYVVAHESRSVLATVLDLAARESLDVYAAPDGALTVKRFDKTSADHVLRYGAEVLAARVGAAGFAEQVVTYAESPSSSQGADTWHWLVKDGSPFRGTAGDGTLGLAVQDGALRSKEAADRSATALLDTMADRSRSGRVRVLGNPAIALGDAIEISGCPYPELDGVFKVAAVRHRFGRRVGCVTDLDFIGIGGAGSAAGAAGGLAGGLAP
jgi:hypothetical protein